MTIGVTFAKRGEFAGAYENFSRAAQLLDSAVKNDRITRNSGEAAATFTFAMETRGCRGAIL
jgi:hypothetical protein